MKTLTVELPDSRSYPIYIGGGILSRAGELLRRHTKSDRAFVVSDENVWPLYGEALLKSLDMPSKHLVLPPGERSKSPAALERIWNALAAAGHRRGDAVIALGGGVVGDVAGFAAATYMRGVPLVQIPTTLLAQVDSSVGGKTAVNLGAGKNLAGAFYQPSLVLSDTNLLRTLPARELASCMAEVIKHAALFDAALLERLTTAGTITDEIILHNCELKRDVVAADEEDRGGRMLLNFGHTFGHAVEKAGNFEARTHGEAVAIGMVLAAKAGEALGVTRPGVADRLVKVLSLHGLPTALPYSWEIIAAGMLGDKKNTGEKITLILLEDFGKPVIYPIPAEKLRALGDNMV